MDLEVRDVDADLDFWKRRFRVEPSESEPGAGFLERGSCFLAPGAGYLLTN